MSKSHNNNNNTSLPFTERVKNLPMSKIASLTAQFNSMKAKNYSVINLAMGSPGHKISKNAMQAAADHYKDQKSIYGSPFGLDALRTKLATKFNKETISKTKFTKDNIIITTGSASATYAIQGCFIEKGDQCLVSVPAYSSYKPAVGGGPLSD